MVGKKFSLWAFFLLFASCSFAQIPDSLAVKPLFFYEKEQNLQKKHLQILQDLQKNTGATPAEPTITPDLFRRQYWFLKNQSPFISATQKPSTLHLRRPPVPKNRP